MSQLKTRKNTASVEDIDTDVLKERVRVPVETIKQKHP